MAACKRQDVAKARALLGACGLLNVGFKALGARGVRCLAEALDGSLEHLELDVSGNMMGVEGAKEWG